MTDFFTDHIGSAANLRSGRRRLLGTVLDPAMDLLLVLEGIRAIDKAVIPRRILAVGIEVPGRPSDIHKVLNRLQQTSRHLVHVSTVAMTEGLGKFANVERALSNVNIYDYEWLLVVDDDVAFNGRMLDRLISLSEMAELSISQPAHSRSSFATYNITLRKPWSFVRETHFVEIGPLTLINRRVFADLIPFPPSRWCYGIDLVWSEISRMKGFKMGIVDAAVVRHLRAVANSYSIEIARAEGESLIKTLKMPFTRAQLLKHEISVSTHRLKALAAKRAPDGTKT